MLLYVDLPKNEIQFRSRAGSITNLGAAEAADPKSMYKRFYFVDWPVLDQHKASLLAKLGWLMDGQRPEAPVFIHGDDFRHALTRMSRSAFRARPWFEPGAWGGQWLKQHIPTLAPEVPNYAWSFELITPENGILLESSQVLLEFSFDWLMIQEAPAVLGAAFAAHFGASFPIRFDYLDTFAGGNLSIQCHPRPEYIRQHFGETYTQDETYYIVDCASDARVYLGFQEGIQPDGFRQALAASEQMATPLDVDQFVHSENAAPHTLYLVPIGTIHCAGQNNLVLEISTTPYIFTFKIYDRMRLDLDGKPRPLNVERAFANLDFSRQGEVIAEQLIAKPRVTAEDDGWAVILLPTHPEHFYDVHRLEFDQTIEVETNGSVHVLNLVEGQQIEVETASGYMQRFSFAETFVVPAVAGRVFGQILSTLIPMLMLF